jgi:hypothetical protein
VLIDHRPAAARNRDRCGDWEGDLIVGAGSRSAIGTLVDRASRYLLLVHLPNKRSAEAVRDALADAFGRLPEPMRLTLTWDQGSELAYHDQIAPLLRDGVFFAHPGSPWRRGTNENTNGLLRQYFPKRTGIPVSRLLEGERQKLLRLDEILHERVVGQDEAVRLVADAVIRARSGVKDPRRPIGSFLFLGPTGVGKTELAKTLAAALFDIEDNMVRLDMSEYQERHRCPGWSVPRPVTSATRRAASSPRPYGASPTPWCCSTRWRRPTPTCSTRCCS